MDLSEPLPMIDPARVDVELARAGMLWEQLGTIRFGVDRVGPVEVFEETDEGDKFVAAIPLHRVRAIDATRLNAWIFKVRMLTPDSLQDLAREAVVEGSGYVVAPANEAWCYFRV